MTSLHNPTPELSFKHLESPPTIQTHDLLEWKTESLNITTDVSAHKKTFYHEVACQNQTHKTLSLVSVEVTPEVQKQVFLLPLSSSESFLRITQWWTRSQLGAVLIEKVSEEDTTQCEVEFFEVFFLQTIALLAVVTDCSSLTLDDASMFYTPLCMQEPHSWNQPQKEPLLHSFLTYHGGKHKHLFYRCNEGLHNDDGFLFLTPEEASRFSTYLQEQNIKLTGCSQEFMKVLFLFAQTLLPQKEQVRQDVLGHMIEFFQQVLPTLFDEYACFLKTEALKSPIECQTSPCPPRKRRRRPTEVSRGSLFSPLSFSHPLPEKACVKRMFGSILYSVYRTKEHFVIRIAKQAGGCFSSSSASSSSSSDQVFHPAHSSMFYKANISSFSQNTLTGSAQLARADQLFQKVLPFSKEHPKWRIVPFLFKAVALFIQEDGRHIPAEAKILLFPKEPVVQNTKETIPEKIATTKGFVERILPLKKLPNGTFEYDLTPPLTEDHTCPVCLHQLAEFSSCPARHPVCYTCLFELNECPICRAPLQEELIQQPIPTDWLHPMLTAPSVRAHSIYKHRKTFWYCTGQMVFANEEVERLHRSQETYLHLQQTCSSHGLHGFATPLHPDLSMYVNLLGPRYDQAWQQESAHS